MPKRFTAAVVLFTFSVATLLSPTAHAYGEITHRDIADWAFRVMRLVNLENKQGQFIKSGPPLKTPPANCQSASCLKDWNEFIAAAAAAPGKLATIPTSTGCAGMGPTVPLGDVTKPLFPPNGPVAPGACGVDFNYDFKGILDSPVLTQNTLGGPFTGVTLGYHAAFADAEFKDWELGVDLKSLAFRAVSWYITAGDPDVLNWIKKIDDVGRQVVTAGLTLVFMMFSFLLLLALSIFDPDSAQKLFEAEQHFAEMLVNIDSALLTPLPLERLGIDGLDDGATVGLGHFINVQPQNDGIPSNEFDDRQGLYYDEAFFVTNPDASGKRTNIQDAFDHDLIDKSSLGGNIDPERSDGVSFYQVFDPDDLHPASRGRAVFGYSPEAYWKQHTIHEITFTPVDNLGYFGWRGFRDDPCRNSSLLERPQHAIQDATVPMHIIGSTGSGHRPYEDAVGNPDVWQQIRRLPDSSGQNTDVAQYEQTRDILQAAFVWRQQIQAFRTQHATTDVPVRDLITAVAQKTQDFVRTQAATASCAVGACHEDSTCTTDGFCSCNSGCASEDSPAPCCIDSVTITCDTSKCQGLDSLSPVCSDQFELQPSSGALFGKCSVTEYVALTLSEGQFQGRAHPALLAPGLSTIYGDKDKGFAISFFADRQQPANASRMINDMRALVEIAVSANLAFLASASELISRLPASCNVPACGSLGPCVDLLDCPTNCSGGPCTCNKASGCCQAPPP
jgi:hypothetical protein